MGLALGYPYEAVRAYNKVIDGKLRDGGYNLVCLAEAKKQALKFHRGSLIFRMLLKSLTWLMETSQNQVKRSERNINYMLESII